MTIVQIEMTSLYTGMIIVQTSWIVITGIAKRDTTVTIVPVVVSRAAIVPAAAVPAVMVDAPGKT